MENQLTTGKACSSCTGFGAHYGGHKCETCAGTGRELTPLALELIKFLGDYFHIFLKKR